MFSFFRRKKPEAQPKEVPAQPPEDVTADEAHTPADTAASETGVQPDALRESPSLPEAQPLPEAQALPEVELVPAPEPARGPESEPAALPEIEPVPMQEPEPDLEHEPEPRLEPEPQPQPAPPTVPQSETSSLMASAPIVEEQAAAPVAKKSWLSRLKEGLSRTGQNLGGIFVGVKVDEDLFEELETALIMADAGMEATDKLLTALRARVKKDRLTDAAQVKTALQEILTDHLSPLEKSFPLHTAKPLVVMIAGVNGAGKTTSIGKLAHAFQAQGASVLLAAADTFRAAAREQLMEWGARNNVTVVAQEGGDPAAVAFDAVNAGRARQAGVVMVDTAGRLPTQLHLMEELKKIKRVVAKADADSPHEILLVVDGNTGQNAISQIKAFDAALGLTGLIVTKLDGTAKGGTLAALAAGSHGVRAIPVYWIGVGEGMNDLQPFVAREFSAALLGE